MDSHAGDLALHRLLEVRFVNISANSSTAPGPKVLSLPLDAQLVGYEEVARALMRREGLGDLADLLGQQSDYNIALRRDRERFCDNGLAKFESMMRHSPAFYAGVHKLSIGNNHVSLTATFGSFDRVRLNSALHPDADSRRCEFRGGRLLGSA
jgi:hypothetical protein